MMPPALRGAPILGGQAMSIFRDLGVPRPGKHAIWGNYAGAGGAIGITYVADSR